MKRSILVALVFSLVSTHTAWGSGGALGAKIGFPDRPSLILQASPGFAFWDSRTDFTMMVSATQRMVFDAPIYLGIELALTMLEPGENPAVRVLPTAYYRFESDRAKAIHYYLGVSGGLNFFRDTAFFELMVRPGMEFSFSKDFGLTVEPRLGASDARFLFLPQLAGTWKL